MDAPFYFRLNDVAVDHIAEIRNGFKKRRNLHLAGHAHSATGNAATMPRKIKGQNTLYNSEPRGLISVNELTSCPRHSRSDFSDTVSTQLPPLAPAPDAAEARQLGTSPLRSRLAGT